MHVGIRGCGGRPGSRSARRRGGPACRRRRGLGSLRTGFEACASKVLPDPEVGPPGSRVRGVEPAPVVAGGRPAQAAEQQVQVHGRVAAPHRTAPHHPSPVHTPPFPRATLGFHRFPCPARPCPALPSSPGPTSSPPLVRGSYRLWPSSTSQQTDVQLVASRVRGLCLSSPVLLSAVRVSETSSVKAVRGPSTARASLHLVEALSARGPTRLRGRQRQRQRTSPG